MDSNTVNIIKNGISLTEWFEKIQHTDFVALLEEDNEKRERMKVLSTAIYFPYDAPKQFSAGDILNNSADFAKYRQDHGEELCAFRLIPTKSGLAKLRMRGLSVNKAIEWLREQNIAPENYRVDIVPHSDNEQWSTIFVVNQHGIFGEILEGKPIELTHGYFLAQQPRLFSFVDGNLKVQPRSISASNHLRKIINLLHVSTEDQLKLKKVMNVDFFGDYLQGYFETVQTKEFGLWFVDYNRKLGEYYTDFQINLEDKAEPKTDIFIKGQPSSGGKATGKVHVVRQEDISHTDFATGDILVTHYTSPDYLPLMVKASAIVTDMGGVLSHASIIARELKLPCIVATINATEILDTGDWVEVDADAGIIRLIK